MAHDFEDRGWSEENGENAINEQDIQTLLEIGYEQLDGFRYWVEEALGLGARIAEQDCFNAECLIDYLANLRQKSISDMDEFDLRWFVFSHYLRKAQADTETEERLLDSLGRFFDYLRGENRELIPEWVSGVLDDGSFYRQRHQSFQKLNDVNEIDEETWKVGFRNWCDELEYDLDARLLWLPREIGNGERWGDLMGWREATLFAEANRIWQSERDRLLRQGFMGEALRVRLSDLYEAWLETPQARLEDQSPLEVIQLERLMDAENREQFEDEDEG